MLGERGRGETHVSCTPERSRSCRTARAIGWERPGVRAVGLFDAPRESVSERSRSFGSAAMAARRRSLRAGTGRSPGRAGSDQVFPEGDQSQRHELATRGVAPGPIRLVAPEAREITAGGEAIIARLADVLVLEAIRSSVTRHTAAARQMTRGPA